MDRLNQMIAFAKVVETGSFTAAAQQLGVGKSAISMAISRLEEQLNTRLLHRSTRQLTLTEAGEGYFQSCQRIVEELSLAEEQLSAFGSEVSGRIRITCPVGFGNRVMLPAIRQFMSEHSALEVDLILEDRSLNLVEEGIDLAVRVAALADSELIAKPLVEAEMVLCASPSYLQQYGTPQTVDDLNHIPWVLYSHTPARFSYEYDGEHYELAPRGRIKVNSELARLQLVVAGEGISAMPIYEAWDDLQAGRLVDIGMGLPLPKVPVTALYQNRKFLPRKLELFLQFLQEYLNKLEWVSGR